MSYDIVVIGTSAGGIEALKTIFAGIKKPAGVPIIVVQHLQPTAQSYLPEILSTASGMHAYEAEDKMPVKDNLIYTPAPNYHLMLEKDWTLSLTVDERVCFARPSIDVTFESVADVAKEKVIGILLTGANHDGAEGLGRIKAMGGYTIVQDPEEAYAQEMPLSALRIMEPDSVLEVKDIAEELNALLTSGERENDE